MKDTMPTVATCNRCGAYVFACLVGGFRVAVNIAPLGVEEYRAALVAGMQTYDQLTQAGRPWRLHARTVSSTWPPFAGREVLADHGCGVSGMDTTGVTAVVPPSSGAASTVKQTVAPDGASHRSKGMWRCMECHSPIEEGESMFAIEHGIYRWARHDRECSSVKTKV